MSSITSNLSSGSGLDVQATVDQLIYTERAPERLMQSQKIQLDTQAAAVQSLQSKLGSLEDAVFTLKDFTGPLTSQTVTSSDSSILTASANSSAVASKHTVVVSALATTSSWYSTSVTDQDFKFATNSSMTVQIGEGTKTSLALDGKTLEQAASYINDSSLGISASVINDATGRRLALVSDTTGTAGRIAITSDTTALGWKTSSPGQNASVTIDGVPVESASNTVSGVIPGVTFSLAKESPSPIVLTVGPDTGKAKQALNSFVSAYNSVVSYLNGQFAYDTVNKKAGALANDSTIVGLQSRLLSEVSHTVTGSNGTQSLRSLGVKMNNDGTLTVDDDALDDALKSNCSEFRNFFQSTTSGSQGFAVHLDSILTAANSVAGPLASDLTGIQNSSKSISDQIDDFEVRISNREQQLIDEYTRIDVMLRNFSATQNQLSAQLGSLSTSK